MSWINKILRLMTEPALPPYLLQITSDRLTGLRVKEGDRREARYFILPLEAGLIEPSAERSNLREPEKLTSLIQNGLKKIGGSGGNLSLLLPESCFRVFIFTAENLPSSSQEKSALIRWRIRKLYPLLPEDFRFDFQVWRENSFYKLLVVGAKTSIIEEYEKLLARAGWQVRVVGLPTIYLLTLVQEPDYLLVNVERDHLALVALASQIPLLYRVKSFRLEREGNLGQQCLAEIENTLHFIEDKEKRQIKKIFLRWAVEPEERTYLVNFLNQSGFEVKGFQTNRFSGFKEEDQEVLTPLLGQLANKEK